MKSISVLVVDSTDNIRNVIVRMLRDLHFVNIFQAVNGLDALKIIDENNIELIISEWMLAKISGRELLQTVRSHPQMATIPFIVCSSTVNQATVVEALECGVSQFIAKPFSFKVFREKLALSQEKPLHRMLYHEVNDRQDTHALVQPTAPTIHSEPSSSLVMPQQRQDFCVLIVDDEVNNIEVASKCINSITRVQVALSGEKAMQLCKQSAPDLILLDIMMPNMDGYQVYEQLQQDIALCDIPVIFLSAKSDDEDVIHGLELGVADYVTKPFNMKILKMRVQNQLNAVKHSKALECQVNEQIRLFTLKENIERIIFNYFTGPLAQIDETLERINQRVLSSKQLKFEMDNIGFASQKLSQVINGLNTILKLEEGTFIPEKTPIGLHEIIGDIQQQFTREQIKKSIQVDNLVSNQTQVIGDKLLFTTMFSELYSNALEASPRGTKVIFFETILDDSVEITLFSASTVHETIKDSFFEKYVTYGKPLGTGLGTYAAKLITEACHGSISLDCKTNETRVNIILPRPLED